MPIVATYLHALRRGLDSAGIPARLLLMQSNGGLTTDTAAAERPMNIIESGPAGGVVGAQALARAKKLEKIITFDMGGTTAKASMVEDGEVARAQEYAVGAGIMIGSRLLTGAGYTLKVPAIDLAEVGAGGGSHVWIDPGGALQAGPESAGAFPGPVCYDKGGEAPTITDANVLLGYINPGHLVGGAVKLNADKARAVFEAKIARPLGMTVERAAYGAHLIAASNMIRAIKAVSTERGRDPREFSLFAFGGNGPLFAAGMAAALGIARVIVPPSAGLFSSFGLLYADVEHHYARTFSAPAAPGRSRRDRPRLDDDGPTCRRAARRGRLHRHERPAKALRGAALQGAELRTHRAGARRADRRPHGDASRGSLRPGARSAPMATAPVPDEPVELVAIQLVGAGLREGSGVPQNVRPSRVEATGEASRRAWFGDKHGWMDTPVVSRADLAEAKTGPLIIDEYDTTCVVPARRPRRARQRRQHRDHALIKLLPI